MPILYNENKQGEVPTWQLLAIVKKTRISLIQI